ncbi:MAG TPA: hypothetical protein VGQ76_11060 [Thermoanaerobaculia bacterium]|nr:hypothetical protein [Thermoanaerobaculia bacterium]
MKLTAVLFALLTLTAPLHAVINGVDPVPAATLLQPYFEVSYIPSNADRTVLTIGNKADAETLAHVTFWTDRGVPAFSFDMRLDARGSKEIDLLALFREGTLPQSTAGGFGSCAATLPPANLNPTQLTQLRRAFTGQSSTYLGGNCGGVNYSQSVARGYITIDVTSACTTLFPSDSGYFVSGGNGIAKNDNVLWGEVYSSNGQLLTAHGTPMVHLEAAITPITDGVPGPDGYCATLPCPPNPIVPLEDYTFYSRMIGSGADNREGLPQQWMGRYDVDDQQTFARIWRDPGHVESFPCNAPPDAIPMAEIIDFDDRENPSANANANAPYATQQVQLSAGTFLSPVNTRGVVLYNLTLPGAAGPATRNQSYVSHLYASGSRKSEAMAWPMSSPAQNIFTPVYGIQPIGPPACSDGIDNDGDGFIDYPNDVGCGRADSNMENPMCNDGDDNDGDGQIDLADSDCYAPTDHVESPIPGLQCTDGIDNDGDGKIDWVEDGGCTGPQPWFDGTENSDTCSDGVDNDGDGKIDYPNDPGCASALSTIENPRCNDGINNDTDTFIDFPADPGCASASSDNEAPACNDGLANDSDGLTDFPADPGCQFAYSTNEAPRCNDGVNNDGDGLIDMADPGCLAPWDTDEFETQCSDGIDNNGDGRFDYPNDVNCFTPDDNLELAACSDGEDNDCDGVTDGGDAGCSSPFDATEGPGLLPQCADGLDNDMDGRVDYPNDPGCTSRADDIEFDAGEPAIAGSTDIPSLSTWGMIVMTMLMAMVAAVALRGGISST